MTGSDSVTKLTPFQIEVAQRFFAMPESTGFLLAGGAGLLAQHLTNRPTHDLDLFTRTAADLPTARDAFEAIARSRGWVVTRIHDGDTFCRLAVTADDALLIDLALDSPPQLPPSVTFLGPSFAPEKLAARKVLALFDRAEARDFADVYQLGKTFQPTLLVEPFSVSKPGPRLRTRAPCSSHHDAQPLPGHRHPHRRGRVATAQGVLRNLDRDAEIVLTAGSRSGTSVVPTTQDVCRQSKHSITLSVPEPSPPITPVHVRQREGVQVASPISQPRSSVRPAA